MDIWPKIIEKQKRDLQCLHFTVITVNTQPQASITVTGIPIGKGAIWIRVHSCPEFQQSQSCIPTPIAIKNKEPYSTILFNTNLGI